MTITTLITDRGRAILAARVPGDPPLASIKIAVGDGNGAFPTPSSAQVALVNERWRGTGSASVDGSKLGFAVNIPAGVGGWNIREIGVFIGNAGTEELAVVSQFDGRYKPAAGENGASSLTPVIYIDYTGSVVGAFTITLDPNLNLIDPNLHRTVVARVTVPPGSPADGSAYAIASGASGDFAGRGGQIAKRRGTAWIFETPLNGHVVREQGATGAWWQKNGADYVAYAFPAADHNHDDRYFTEAEITALLGGKSNTGHAHDDRYYTEAEMNAFLGAKSDTGHHHDDRYFTEAEVNALLALRVAKTGDTMTGNPRVQKAWPTLDLLADPATAGQISAFRGTSVRNILQLIDQQVESGGNTGSDVVLLQQDDAGVFLREAIRFVRSNGRVGINNSTPQSRLDVTGDTISRGFIRAAPAGISGDRAQLEVDSGLSVSRLRLGGHSAGEGGSVVQYERTSGMLVFRLGTVASDNERLKIGADGRVYFNGDSGTTSTLLIGNAGGAPLWRTLAQLGIGSRIIASGSVGGTSTNVTFATAEPDTLYTALIIGGAPFISGSQSSEICSGALSAKTVNGCTVSLSNPPGGSGLFMNYVIFRQT